MYHATMDLEELSYTIFICETYIAQGSWSAILHTSLSVLSAVMSLEFYKILIHELYIERNETITDVINILQDEYDFAIT